jgi:hypothetical protein
VKQRKIAISLAVVGAIAAPFVFGTYNERPIAKVWTSFDEEPWTKEYYKAIVAKTNNCQTFEYYGGPDARIVRFCLDGQKALEEGGYYGGRQSTPLYLALNAAVAVVTFAVIFGLTYLLPALARRYWQWLKT